MLRLQNVSISFLVLSGQGTHPDSVNLVRPPNTTIPKTLAALPNSQYPTTVPSCFGKNVGFAGTILCWSLRKAWLRESKGEFIPLTLRVPVGVELPSRVQLHNDCFDGCFDLLDIGLRTGLWRQRQDEKSRRDNRGVTSWTSRKMLLLDAIVQKSISWCMAFRDSNLS